MLFLSDTLALLSEMNCQRLAQDYQHIINESTPKPADKANLTVIYFSLRNQIHCLKYDRRTNTIDVRRYVHRRVVFDSQLVKFSYHYFLWSAHANAFLPMQRDIEPNRDDIKWSEADNVLCDRYQADLTGLKYRCNQSEHKCKACPA